MIYRPVKSELQLRKAGALFVLMAVMMTFSVGESDAQILPAEPARMAASVGVAWIVPGGNLALKDPGDFALDDPGDGRYATPGTALIQRFSMAPWKHLGFFFQASFPAFGMDGAAAQEDFGSDPPITGGSNDITAWNVGVRWRGGGSWSRGFYLETMVGWHRAQFEIEYENGQTDGATFDWEIGWAAAVGWVFPLGPAFAVDTALALHEFKEDYFMNRWFGLRILAVLTFGGKR